MEVEALTQSIWNASQKRLACSIALNNDKADRTIHPYGVCKTEKNHIVLVCWQVGGYTEKGNLPQFRNLILTNITSFKLLDNKFVVQPSFNPHDKQYVEWVFHI